MTTKPQLAAVSRKYTAEISASLDPFEEPYVDEDDTIAIHDWLRHVERSMAAHRSPFIAAEILLKEMEEFSQRRLHRPERLYVATAFPVLRHCLSAITPEYRDIISAAVQELLPAMAFTVVKPPIPGINGEESAKRIPYSECFWRVYALFQKHQHTIEVQTRRAEVEAVVMDRVVLSLDRLWMKMCFLSWKIHCRRLREKKVLFKKLALRGMAGHIVPRYIRAWRQHAHSVILSAKIARNTEVTKELEALFPQEQHAKGLHERLNEEVIEKMRMLKEETARTEQIRAKLETLKTLFEETQESLHSHWRTWRLCMSAMFGDSHPINRALDEDYTSHVVYQQNITDTAELYSKRARARMGKVGIKQIQSCLRSQGFLPSDSGDKAPAESSEDSGGQEANKPQTTRGKKKNAQAKGASDSSGGALTDAKNGPSKGNANGGKKKLKYVKVPLVSASVDAVVEAFTQACKPIVSPLRLIDLFRCNQVEINVALSFLSCMYSGGHCSLFWPPSTPALADVAKRSSSAEPPSAGVSPSSRAVATKGPQSAEGPDSNAEDVDQPPPEDIVACMMEDVDDGMQRISSTLEGNDHYMLSIRRCMERNVVDVVQDYLGIAFFRFSTMGLPLNRDKVEQALMSLVRPVDGPVIHALYPDKGIHTFTEFSEYLTKIAEFSSMPLISVAERLENGYDFSPREDMLYALGTSEDIRLMLRENQEYITRLQEWAKDEQERDLLNKARGLNLLQVKLGLSEEYANDVWKNAGSDPETVAKVELEELLYLAAAYLDPSPFTPPSEKLAAVIDRCVPFLLDL